MTVQDLDPEIIYTGTGGVTQFDFAFESDEADFIFASVDDVDSHPFTVTMNPDQDSNPGGDVEFDVAPISGSVVRIWRSTDVTQETAYPDYARFPASSHERALDKLTMIIQEIWRSLSSLWERALIFPELNPLDNTVPTIDDRKNKYFFWDADGNPAVASSTDGGNEDKYVYVPSTHYTLTDEDANTTFELTYRAYMTVNAGTLTDGAMFRVIRNDDEYIGLTSTISFVGASCLKIQAGEPIMDVGSHLTFGISEKWLFIRKNATTWVAMLENSLGGSSLDAVVISDSDLDALTTSGIYQSYVGFTGTPEEQSGTLLHTEWVATPLTEATQFWYPYEDNSNSIWTRTRASGSWTVWRNLSGVGSVVAGTGIGVDNTDPANPIISSTVSGGVETIVAGTGIAVNNADPQNPIVSSAPQTTAGLINRNYGTGETVTLTEGTFGLMKTNKGTVDLVNQVVSLSGNGDTAYFASDFVRDSIDDAGILPAGNYSGNITIESSSGQAQFSIETEVYLCDAQGVVIDSGITGQPIGDLGVKPVSVLNTGIIELGANDLSSVGISGVILESVNYPAGIRVRMHTRAVKHNGGNANITMYAGYDANTYVDSPVSVNTDGVINKSNVAGATSTDAFNALDAGKAELAGDAAQSFDVATPAVAVDTKAINQEFLANEYGLGNTGLGVANDGELKLVPHGAWVDVSNFSGDAAILPAGVSVALKITGVNDENAVVIAMDSAGDLWRYALSAAPEPPLIWGALERYVGTGETSFIGATIAMSNGFMLFGLNLTGASTVSFDRGVSFTKPALISNKRAVNCVGSNTNRIMVNLREYSGGWNYTLAVTDDGFTTVLVEQIVPPTPMFAGYSTNTGEFLMLDTSANMYGFNAALDYVNGTLTEYSIVTASISTHFVTSTDYDIYTLLEYNSTEYMTKLSLVDFRNGDISDSNITRLFTTNAIALFTIAGEVYAIDNSSILKLGAGEASFVTVMPHGITDPTIAISSGLHAVIGNSSGDAYTFDGATLEQLPDNLNSGNPNGIGSLATNGVDFANVDTSGYASISPPLA